MTDSIAQSPARGAPVITAVVLINAAVDAIPEIAEQVSQIDGITEVYSVAGDVDLVAMVRVAAHEDLADVIAGRLNKVVGILSTQTLIAFRTYSKHDLDAAFSLGIDGA
ncbi:MAG TPA: Lrp/AsnC ligand binding domain-containing protein [Mycobacteriales bacterium]|nr:Lrp/AsnC ligand binding domain-containing protein [Mycobacteriales bacterium]